MNYARYGPALAFDGNIYYSFDPDYVGFRSAASASIDFYQWLQFSFDLCVRVFHVNIFLSPFGPVSNNLGNVIDIDVNGLYGCFN